MSNTARSHVGDQAMTPNTVTQNINAITTEIGKQRENLYLTNKLNAEEIGHADAMADKHNKEIEQLRDIITQQQTQIIELK